MGSVSWDQYLPKTPGKQSPVSLNVVAPPDVTVVIGQPGHPTSAVFFAPRSDTSGPGPVSPELPTTEVVLNEPPVVKYDVMLDTDMLKVSSDMLWIDYLWIQQCKSAKFGYLSMMAVATLGALNAESFCELVFCQVEKKTHLESRVFVFSFTSTPFF
jgi:hypothetical protein